MRRHRLMPAGGFLLWALVCGLGTTAYADPVVLRGSDYLHTLPGTTFAGADFTGVPIGPGNTDTIVERLADASFTGVGDSDTIPIELVALSLASTTPIDLGGGLGFYYITLQSARGGPASTGQMTIQLDSLSDNLPNSPEGTFSSFFDVFFDIRLGATNGPIIISDDLLLTSAGTPWDADPPPGAIIVSGSSGSQSANSHTGKGVDEMDFFPFLIQETHPSGARHVVELATPEPGTAWLLAAGLLALVGFLRKKHGSDKSRGQATTFGTGKPGTQKVHPARAGIPSPKALPIQSCPRR